MYRLPQKDVRGGWKAAARLQPLAAALILAMAGSGQSSAEELMYVSSQVNDGWKGLGGISAIAISPDNSHVYTAAATDLGIGLFKRESDGRAGYLDFYLYSHDLPDSGIPIKVIVSPDGAHLYAAFNTLKKTGVVARYDRGDSGALSLKESHAALTYVRDLVMSSDGKSLYLSGDDSVVSFERNVATGELTNLETVNDGGNGVDGLAGGAGMALTADGKHLFVAGAADNGVAVFRRDTITGKLAYVSVLRNDAAKGIIGLNGTRAVAVSPDGGNLYVASATDDALAVFRRDYVTGNLSYIEAWTKSGVNGKNKAPLDAVSYLAVSPNGSRVYASSATQGAIAIFRTVPESRKLDFVEVQEQGGGGVVSLALSPNGAYLYATAPASGNGTLSTFRTANSAPVANDDFIELKQGGAVTLHLLANDTDPDNDALRLAGGDSLSAHGGSLVFNGDGTVTYTAKAGFVGSDSFSYLLSDVRDAESVTAHAFIKVTDVSNPEPVAVVDSDSGGNGGGGSIDGWFVALLATVLCTRRRARR